MIFGLILLAIIICVVISCVKVVRQAQALVIERLGAYQATWGTGLHFKIPIFDRVARRVDLKEQVVDFAPQPDCKQCPEVFIIITNSYFYHSMFPFTA